MHAVKMFNAFECDTDEQDTHRLTATSCSAVYSLPGPSSEAPSRAAPLDVSCDEDVEVESCPDELPVREDDLDEVDASCSSNSKWILEDT